MTFYTSEVWTFFGMLCDEGQLRMFHDNGNWLNTMAAPPPGWTKIAVWLCECPELLQDHPDQQAKIPKHYGVVYLYTSWGQSSLPIS